MNDQQYTPKQIAEITGFSIYTLHYYERIGLLDPVPREPNGHRRYRDTDLRRLDFLKRLKATGMTLDAMGYYVDLFRQGDATVTERRLILKAHREQVLEQVAVLQDTIALLDTKIANYHEQEAALSVQA